jgi:hypothetical protein
MYAKVFGRLQRRRTSRKLQSVEVIIQSNKLPSELWILISKYLDFSNLSTLTQVSRYLMEILRPILYGHQIILSPICVNVKSTFALLASDTQIAQAVTSIHLSATIFFPVKIVLDALRAVPSLKKFRFEARIFTGSKHPQQLANVLQHRNKPLEELWVDGAFCYDVIFKLSGLVSLKWTDPRVGKYILICPLRFIRSHSYGMLCVY